MSLRLLLVVAVVGVLSGSVGGARPAFAGPDPVPAAQARFGWPLEGRPRVVRRFEPPPRPWLAGHRGVDLAAEPVVPVRAAGAGVVRFAGEVAGRGVVSIDHADGLRTTYEPVTPVVAAGTPVKAGELIGALDAGHPGCPVIACLHWGLRRGATYLDPLALVGAARVRLLPLSPLPSGGAQGPGSTARLRGQAQGPGSTGRLRGGAQARARNAGRRSASRSYSSGRL